MRVLPLVTSDVVRDGVRGRLYASVPAGAQSPYANSVVTIDPATSKIIASTYTGHGPVKIALTAGGENLYVSLRGNDTIGRITPSDMTLVAAFTVGAHAQ